MVIKVIVFKRFLIDKISTTIFYSEKQLQEEYLQVCLSVIDLLRCNCCDKYSQESMQEGKIAVFATGILLVHKVNNIRRTVSKCHH
jgi:hypothetical protein